MTSSDLVSQLGCVTEEDYVALSGKKLVSVRNERSLGLGPPHIKIGKRILYPLVELKKYLEAHTVRPESAPSLIHGTKRRGRNPQSKAA
jgi:hypothetical protein